MATTVQKWGNSFAVRIPRVLIDELGINEGARVELSVSEGDLIVRPARPRTVRLADLLSKITADNIHAEVDSASAVGREAW